MTDFEFHPLCAGHIPDAVALCRAAGWAYREKDWDMLLPFSTGRVAMIEGKVQGTVLRSDFGADLSTINMLIVAQAMRSQGLGRALTTSVLPADGRTARLVATLSGWPLYEKLGFRVAQHMAQHQGSLSEPPELAPGMVAAAEPEDLKMIETLESESFGGDRSAPLSWLARKGHLAVLRRKGVVVGFAGCRRFGRGHAIGPVVAPDLETAQMLIGFHLQAHAGEFVRLDVTGDSGLSPWLARIGLPQVSAPPLMIRGDSLHTGQRMALFSQALG